ncbi:MAG: hypothetical protein II001_00790 [Bacteroidales bacterium]|nr:hypothetical protein [Bacteroidales bacterium]
MIREINGKKYDFKITRKGIRAAEKAGMKMQSIVEQPMLFLSYMWYAAIYAAQPVTFEKSCDLLDEYLDSEDCSESIEQMLTDFSNEYAEVFGLAAE